MQALLEKQLESTETAFTSMFLGYCQSTCEQFDGLTGRTKKRSAEALGWESSTPNPYIKVWEFFGKLPAENVCLLDPQTLIALAKEKYAPIHEALMEEPLTVAEVRSLAKEINALNRKPKAPAKQVEWKGRGSDRFLQIQIPDCSAATTFKQYHQESGVPIPLFIEEVNTLIAENKSTLKSDESAENLKALENNSNRIGAVSPPQNLYWVARSSDDTSNLIDVGSRIEVIECSRGWKGHKGAVVCRELTDVFDSWQVKLDVALSMGVDSNLFFTSSQLDLISEVPHKSCEPITLLQVQLDGGDITEFIGAKVTVLYLSGKVKFAGKMLSFDERNYAVVVETEDGDRYADLREAWV